MSVVHDAVETVGRRNHRTHLLAATLLTCCVLPLGGCGGSSANHAAGSTQAGVGESLRLDNCSDWNRATVAERRATVSQLRRFAGGPVGSSAGNPHGPVINGHRAVEPMPGFRKHL